LLKEDKQSSHLGEAVVVLGLKYDQVI